MRGEGAGSARVRTGGGQGLTRSRAGACRGWPVMRASVRAAALGLVLLGLGTGSVHAVTGTGGTLDVSYGVLLAMASTSSTPPVVTLPGGSVLYAERSGAVFKTINVTGINSAPVVATNAGLGLSQGAEAVIGTALLEMRSGPRRSTSPWTGRSANRVRQRGYRERHRCLPGERFCCLGSA